MPFIDPSKLPVHEPRPGWSGRFFHSANMTFAYYEIAAGAEIHAHEHDNEEVWNVLDGTLELTLDGESRTLGAGHAVVVPARHPHSARAVEPTRVIVVDHPVRTQVGGAQVG